MTNNAKALILDISTCAKVVFYDRVGKVEKLTSSVSSLVQTANLNISENE